MTRPELLEAFRSFDNQVLEKLLTYGSLLLVPEEDLLVNVTMKQMVDKAHVLANEFFPAWTDRSKADFGQFIVELLAMQSEKDFWYINAFANERHLRDMSVYADAFVRSIEMGYEPQLHQGASAPFTFTFAAGDALTIPVGGLVVSPVGTGLQFTNDAPVVVTLSVAPLVLTLTLNEGSFNSTTVTFNGHETPITKSGMDLDSVSVVINDSLWSRVRVFGQSGPQSKHYALLPDENASVTVYFGDEGFGLRPSVGDTLLVRYRLCAGLAGNTPKNTVNVNTAPSVRLITQVLMVDAAKGGVTQESLASLKNSAPLYARFKKAAFNQTSTENFLLSLPPVKKAKCVTVSNNVYFYVVPTDPRVDETTLLGQLGLLLRPYLMYGYECTPSKTNYVKLTELTLELYALDRSNLRKLERQAAEVISDYTDPRVGASYGQSFVLSDLADLLRARLSGVQNVRFISVNGTTPADVLVSNTRILTKVDPNVLSITAFIK